MLIMLIQLLFIDPISYLMVAVAILLGFSIHEYFHAQASYLLGDPTAKYSGRLTINPLADISRGLLSDLGDETL